MKTTLRSNELSCPSCVNTIESDLNNREGIESAKVHFTTGRIEVQHDPNEVSQEDLVQMVKKNGYEAQVSIY